MKIKTRNQIETEIRGQIPEKVYRSSPAIQNLVAEKVNEAMAEQAGDQWATADHAARAQRIADRIGKPAGRPNTLDGWPLLPGEDLLGPAR